jgi:hypothetical protein
MITPVPPSRSIRLGLRENLGQFLLLVAVNALVGGMIGQERTVLPLLAEEDFGLSAVSTTLTFIMAFGLVKAVTNFFAGTLSDRFGRKPVLVTGWLIGVPVPVMIMWAPTWGWVVAANVLLGLNQGLTWSTTVIMKIDLVGPAKRGLAMGFNEAAGYGAVAVAALVTGFIAAEYGLRPEPFFLGIAFAALGLGLSVVFVRETHGHARHEAANHVTVNGDLHAALSTRRVFVLTSFRERALSACSQAGLVNNLNDGLAWGCSPCTSPPAESEGFEPSEALRPQRFSRPSHSSALATLRRRYRRCDPSARNGRFAPCVRLDDGEQRSAVGEEGLRSTARRSRSASTWLGAHGELVVQPGS